MVQNHATPRFSNHKLHVRLFKRFPNYLHVYFLLMHAEWTFSLEYIIFSRLLIALHNLSGNAVEITTIQRIAIWSHEIVFFPYFVFILFAYNEGSRRQLRMYQSMGFNYDVFTFTSGLWAFCVRFSMWGQPAGFSLRKVHVWHQLKLINPRSKDFICSFWSNRYSFILPRWWKKAPILWTDYGSAFLWGSVKMFLIMFVTFNRLNSMY